MTTNRNVVPLIVSAILFVALVGSTYSYRARLHDVEEDARQLSVQSATDEARDSTLLTVGDTLPAVQLRRADGSLVDLRQLRGRYRYLYFGRSSCPSCSLLRTYLDTAEASRLDSVAFIAYSADSGVTAGKGANDFQWVPSAETLNRYVNRVPSVLVIQPDGRVSAAAQGSVLRAAALLDYFHVVARGAIEQQFREASAVPVAAPAATSRTQAGQSRS